MKTFLAMIQAHHIQYCTWMGVGRIITWFKIQAGFVSCLVLPLASTMWKQSEGDLILAVGCLAFRINCFEITGVRENKDQTNEVRVMRGCQKCGRAQGRKGNNTISLVPAWLKGDYNVLQSRVDGLKQICLDYWLKQNFMLAHMKANC